MCVALCVFVCMCLCLSVKVRRCRDCKSKLKTSKRLDAFCCTLLTLNQLEILDNWKTNCIGTCESNTMEDDEEEEEEEELSLFSSPTTKLHHFSFSSNSNKIPYLHC